MADLPIQLRKILEAGLDAGRKFLESEVMKTLAVQAPYRIMRAKKSGRVYYRALTKAKQGAPPRRISGNLQHATASYIHADGLGFRVGTLDQEAPYGAYLEGKNHQYMQPTLNRVADQLAAVMAEGWRRATV
jgi:hypothetical protein